MIVVAALLLVIFDFSFLDKIIGVGDGISFEGGKFFVVFALLALFFAYGNGRRLLTLPKDLLILGFYTLLVFLSLEWSVSRGYALRTLFPWMVAYMLMVAVYSLGSGRLIKLEGQFLAAAKIGLFLATLNLIVGAVTGRGWIDEPFGGVRLGFVDFLPAWYAAYLVYLGIYLYFNWRFGRGGLLSILMFSMLCFVLFLMNIRAYSFGLLVSIFLFEFVERKGFLRKLLIAGACVVLLSLPVLLYQPLREKMFQDQESAGLEVSKVRLSDRDKIAIYLIGQSASRSWPLMGSGAGAARYYLTSSGNFENTAYSHSDYVRIFVELGFLGLISYLLLWVYFCLRIRRAYRRIIELKDVPARTLGATAITASYFMMLAGLVYDVFTPVNVVFVLMFVAFFRNRLDRS